VELTESLYNRLNQFSNYSIAIYMDNKVDKESKEFHLFTEAALHYNRQVIFAYLSLDEFDLGSQFFLRNVLTAFGLRSDLNR